MWLPFGWKKYEQGAETLFVGYTFRPSWPLFALASGYLFWGYLSIATSLLSTIVLVCTAAVLSLLHGYRITISENGINFAWTYCGVVYRRIDLPLRSNIRTTGGFGDPDDRLIIEASVSSEDVELLLTEKTIELGEELKKAQIRWQDACSSACRQA